MKKHFVTFFSPGTFLAEEDTKPIDSWDVDKAVEMSKSITQRYYAKPYGFRFSTRGREEGDLDSKVIATSHMYYLGGEVLTLREIEKRKDPKDSILISNMKANGYNKVVVNTNSYKWTQPLQKGDIVLKYP